MLKEIQEHRTIRKYTDKLIPKTVMDSILGAAIRASNTGNMQVYSIIVTTDSKIKDELAPAHFNQPMVKNAPAILTFCADFNRFNKWCSQRNAEPGYDNFLSFLTAAIDAIIAAQNACVEAEANGLGICYLGTAIYNADKIIDVLNLPKGVVPVTAVTIGYPDETPELTDRLPAEAVVHYERYKDYTPEDINKLYAEKESRQDSKQFIAENNKETLAQVFTDVRYPKDNNEHFSKVLLSVLKKQGFLK
ncbi:MAG: nitroreductase family protein [Bacteroidales bacterium]|nr:nitroreductase family protein [Bacteroidales bacterium]MDD4215833.1 nitroreductase family protein [Bacteroidales bacterium]MDY0141977.1 nitroreductase family protein [Bacteroidales bacterium]